MRIQRRSPRRSILNISVLIAPVPMMHSVILNSDLLLGVDLGRGRERKRVVTGVALDDAGFGLEEFDAILPQIFNGSFDPFMKRWRVHSSARKVGMTERVWLLHGKRGAAMQCARLAWDHFQTNCGRNSYFIMFKCNHQTCPTINCSSMLSAS